MTEWFRFGFILVIAAADHALYEMRLSYNTTRDFLRYRLQWVVREKFRTLSPWRER